MAVGSHSPTAAVVATKKILPHGPLLLGRIGAAGLIAAGVGVAL